MANTRAARRSAGAQPRSARARLIGSLRPRATLGQIVAGALCALLGFALVAQIRHAGADELATLRQDDLVLLLDDLTVRADQLQGEVDRLRTDRDELASGVDLENVALEIARARATHEGILSGRLPASGPGIEIVLSDPGQVLRSAHLFHLTQELRNAGAEVIEVSGVRLVASSSFVDIGGAITLDGQGIASPFVWVVIGDPDTLDRAIEIQGGALALLRREGAEATVERLERVTVTATV
ncbi:MAG: DUF881 domain-containing protein, partial [Promicromonosporaceae bacterium]|nr:DUF881 domain-containing protein [Promicromonosporaceae bacterium]